jgi:hypothetical protein
MKDVPEASVGFTLQRRLRQLLLICTLLFVQDILEALAWLGGRNL